MEKINKTKVLAFLNQKGGVAKTTLTTSIAYSMANTFGKKVLVIDWDTQASLSHNVGAPVGDQTTPASMGVVDLFYDYIIYDMPLSFSNTKIDACIYKPFFFKSVKYRDKERNVYATRQEKFAFGFDLLSASDDLATLNMRISLSGAHQNKHEEFWNLTFLAKLTNYISKNYDYDFILIDCAPALDNLSINAFLAAKDGIIIPTNMDVSSIRGVSKVINTFFSLYDKYNELAQTTDYLGFNDPNAMPHRGILGIAFNMYTSRRAIDSTVENLVDKFLPFKAFNTRIPDSVDAKVASFNYEAVNTVSSKLAAAYDSLAEEIINLCKQKLTADELSDMIYDSYQIFSRKENIEENECLINYKMLLEEKVKIAHNYYKKNPKEDYPLYIQRKRGV